MDILIGKKWRRSLNLEHLFSSSFLLWVQISPPGSSIWISHHHLGKHGESPKNSTSLSTRGHCMCFKISWTLQLLLFSRKWEELFKFYLRIFSPLFFIVSDTLKEVKWWNKFLFLCSSKVNKIVNTGMIKTGEVPKSRPLRGDWGGVGCEGNICEFRC